MVQIIPTADNTVVERNPAVSLNETPEMVIYHNPNHGPERQGVEPDFNAWTERRVPLRQPDQGMEVLEQAFWELGRQGRMPQHSYDLYEALLNNPDAANALRNALRYIAFESYANTRSWYELVTKPMPSNNQSEYYWRGSAFGTLNKVPSGHTAPTIQKQSEGGTQIINERWANIVEVTGDDIMFDRVGIYNTIAEEIGQAARMTIDATVFAQITDTSNYTRSQTNGDNDVGANQQDLTWSLDNFNTAYNVVRTMRDRKSRTPSMCMPDTLVCTPLTEMFIRQSLMSPSLSRVGANANEIIGQGTNNPYYGMIRNIVVCPFMGLEYQWGIFDSAKNKLYYQEVYPYNVYGEPQAAASTAWFEREVIRYMTKLYFGVGFVDDRQWFYSPSTTKPTVA